MPAIFPLYVPWEQGCVVALRAGTGHIGLNGRLELARSTDRGATWQQDRVPLADSEPDDHNPALGLAPDGRLVLAYHWQGGYDDDGVWDPANPLVDTRLAFSNDRGHTWIDDRLLDFTPLDGESPFGKIRTIEVDGSDVMLMPIYGGPPPARLTSCVPPTGGARGVIPCSLPWASTKRMCCVYQRAIGCSPLARRMKVRSTPADRVMRGRPGATCSALHRPGSIRRI